MGQALSLYPSPLTPACVSQCCSQLWTDQPLCPQHKHPSSFWGQNGFWPAQPAVCSLLGSRRETSGSSVSMLKCCYRANCRAGSETTEVFTSQFNICSEVLQLCHKTPQLALHKFSALVGDLELLHCPSTLSGAEVPNKATTGHFFPWQLKSSSVWWECLWWEQFETYKSQ